MNIDSSQTETRSSADAEPAETERKVTPWRSDSSYKDSGVDIEAGDRAVEALKPHIRKATRPEVVGGIGGFAGLFALDVNKYANPLLAASTDGVGTKLVVAQKMDIHDTVGVDLVAMVVDDLVVCGAEPLFLLDYIACGSVVPERIADLGAGISDGCRYAGCALIGGEIAEHPGVLRPEEYDVSATGVGVVESDAQLGPDKVRDGDAIIGMASSGLHSNGFSLVRHVLLGEAGMPLNTVVPEFGQQRTLGEELLTPTKIYAKDCLAIISECQVHAFAHVTGGGIPGNLVRTIPEHLDAVVDRASWRPQPVYDLIAKTGDVSPAEMERTFNMGMGMAAIVPADQVDRTMALLTARGVESWLAGHIVEGRGEVRMNGTYKSD